MYTNIKTFEEYGWPFITRDYLPEETYKEYKDNVLARASIDNSTTTEEMFEFVGNAIYCGATAIMVDYHNILNSDNTALFTKLKGICDSVFIKRLGFSVATGYEYRLAYVLLDDGFIFKCPKDE